MGRSILTGYTAEQNEDQTTAAQTVQAVQLRWAIFLWHTPHKNCQQSGIFTDLNWTIKTIYQLSNYQDWAALSYVNYSYSQCYRATLLT